MRRLYTTLCLQFKPQHIAASALLLAAKLLKFKFPFKGWWKVFNVTPHQLEGICDQSFYPTDLLVVSSLL